MLERASVRLPEGETTPKPEPHECVVFQNQFTAGLRMPCQDFIEEILKAYNIEMHHLTLNEIAKIALFVWAVKSQKENLDIGAFLIFMRCKLNSETRWWMAKLLSNTLVAVVLSLSPTSKNKWIENWYRYWFYHSVPLVEERDDTRKIVK
jgi:hypothetical protein